MIFTTTHDDITRADVRAEPAAGSEDMTFLRIDTTGDHFAATSGFAYLSPTEARQLIDVLEQRAAPVAPDPLPPIDVAEVLDAALQSAPRYAVWCLRKPRHYLHAEFGDAAYRASTNPSGGFTTLAGAEQAARDLRAEVDHQDWTAEVRPA